jgi:hypothetical protein
MSVAKWACGAGAKWSSSSSWELEMGGAGDEVALREEGEEAAGLPPLGWMEEQVVERVVSDSGREWERGRRGWLLLSSLVPRTVRFLEEWACEVRKALTARIVRVRRRSWP